MSDDFVPISPNPYIVGNPVRGRAMFFGREAEFALVQKRFGDSAHGGLFVFCGERRSGKTSILFQILDHRLGANFIPVLIDMQSMAVGNSVEFLVRLSDEILTALDGEAAAVAKPDFLETSNPSGTFQRFVRECLRAYPGKKLILLFDEYELFENKIDAGNLAEDVLYILGSLMESEPVFMIFTGSQHLEQRRREYWKVLGKSIYKTVSYLERDDAVSLIRQPVEGRVRFDDPSVDAILRLAAGQPFYTQAICQNLVDHLNEARSREVTTERVGEVVDAMINNPLPQMIFLWDGLEREDKIVMALLAECLEDRAGHANVDDLLKHVKKKRYPLEVDVAAIATPLEKLYKSEMLLRSDRGTSPAYAFRMDLWRLWIRRQHSVWQVMREEGLAVKKPNRRRRLVYAGAVSSVVLIGAVAVMTRRRNPDPGAVLPTTGYGFLVLTVDPADATVRMDGRRIGIGALRDSFGADVNHRVEVIAPGYADSGLTLRIPKGDTLSRNVALRALVGDLRVETQPPDAEVRVDGQPKGKSPLTVHGLAVAKPHVVEASRAGFGIAKSQVSVTANAVATAALTLEVGKVDVLVTTDPSAAAISVDGKAHGSSPVTLAALSFGRHSIKATRDGYNGAETTLVVTSDTRQLRWELVREAPGVLVVRGDMPAQIYVDGVLVVENVQNSGPRSLSPGVHAVRAILVSGQTVDASVAVHSGERVIFDFSSNSTTRRPEGGR